MVRIVSDMKPILRTMQLPTRKWICVLPLEVDWRPDSPRDHVGTTSGAADQEAVDLSQGEQCRFEPPNGARSKWPQHGLPLPVIKEPCRLVPGDTVLSVGPGAGRHRLGATDPTYPGLAKRRQKAGILPPNLEGSTGVPEFSGPAGQHVASHFEPVPYKDVLPGRDDPVHRARLPAEQDRLVWFLDAALMDTVAHLQLDMRRCGRDPSVIGRRFRVIGLHRGVD